MSIIICQILWYIGFILFVYGKHIKKFFIATHRLFFWQSVIQRDTIILKPKLTKSAFTLSNICARLLFFFSAQESVVKRRESPWVISVYPIEEACFYFSSVHPWILVCCSIHGNAIFTAVDNSNVMNGTRFWVLCVIMCLRCFPWIILLKLHNNPVGWVLILSLLYGWGKQ